MAPQGDAYHIDWICSNSSDVHVANNKAWFTTITDFKTKLDDVHYGPSRGADVLGIGDVELEVVKSVTPGGKKTFRTLVLRDVLYAPTNITNIFACNMAPFYTLDFHSRKVLDPDTGSTVAMLDIVQLPKLWLKGQPRGKSILDPGRFYMINASWSDEERVKWETHKQKQKQAASFPTSRYNAVEKAWLKKHFGNEFVPATVWPEHLQGGRSR